MNLCDFKKHLAFCLLASASIAFTGCGTIKITPKIERGGFLRQSDYDELQRVADLKPIEWPKSWADKIPSPKWVYSSDASQDFRRFDSVAIPDLVVNVAEARALAKEIPDAIAKEFKAKKLFREITRAESDKGFALVGGLTSADWGNYLAGTLLGNQSHFLQAEFKIMVDGKQVGVVQAYAQRSTGFGNLLLKAMQGKLASQMADDVVASVTSLRGGFPAHASEALCLPTNSQKKDKPPASAAPL